MKTMKKVLSVFLTLLMIVSIIPMSTISASAANGIQAKIDELRAVYYTGTYFTKSGGPCYDYGGADCALSNIPSRGGLPAGSTVSNAIGNGWSCNGFARYAFYYVFGKAFGTSTVVSTPSLGDIIQTSSSYGTHYSMYLGEDANNYYVYDSNGALNATTKQPDCSVRYYGALSKSKNSLVKVYHASNYDSVNGSTPTPDIDWVTGLAGQYYLESKDTGYWLSVSESKDASTQPINTWGTWWENFRVKLTASGNGYKINFPLVSSLLVNPYSDTPASGTKINLYQDVNDSTQWWGFEKVGDAYAIRCLYNPSLVLTSNGTAQATLTTYTGAANQLWYLHPSSYTVSYNSNGGSGAPSSQTKNFNEALTLSSTKPTRSGYTFLGWSTSSTATSATYSAGSNFTTNANTTLYAVWKANTYTISYNANGGSGAPSSQTKYHNQNLTLSSTVPTRIGYIFVGWGTSSGDTTVDYYAGGTYTQNSAITLYAIWTPQNIDICIDGNPNNRYLTLTFGDIDSANYYLSISESYGNPISYSYSASNSNVDCYLGILNSVNQATFSIYAESTGETTITISVKDATTDTVLDTINVYVTINTKEYTVSYNANGGTGAPSSQTKYHNQSLTLSSTVPTRSGYTFLGWTTNSTATTATYQPGATFTINQNITFYAVWQKNAVAEPEIHVSSTNINLTLGEIENIDVYAWATDVTVAYTFRFAITDTNIVTCSWGDWTDDKRCPLTITAKSKGTTTVTISLIDYETQAVLDSVTVTVNVGVSASYVDFSIKEPSTTTIRYKDGIALHIEGNIPDGARVEWAVDSDAFVGGTYDDGMSCLLVSKNNGYTTVTATLYDANNNVLATDSVELRSKAGFFDKIGGFFRGLFGTTKVYDA
ncbi:MAG: InlB B-repeat-containing protein [Clostridia bacterium]|nr:InlB B-repeat-containing protein [Clostridia bacterium]